MIVGVDNTHIGMIQMAIKKTKKKQKQNKHVYHLSKAEVI